MKVKIINKAVSKKNARRVKRRLRIRGKISGTAVTPRMNFFKSNKNIVVQVIDDRVQKTLVSISTLESAYKSLTPTVETAKKLGEDFGVRLREKNIESVVFDRNGYKYHGVLKAFVDAVREKDIKV